MDELAANVVDLQRLVSINDRSSGLCSDDKLVRLIASRIPRQSQVWPLGFKGGTAYKAKDMALGSNMV
jgi:hypothetical protein